MAGRRIPPSFGRRSSSSQLSCQEKYYNHGYKSGQIRTAQAVRHTWKAPHFAPVNTEHSDIKPMLDIILPDVKELKERLASPAVSAQDKWELEGQLQAWLEMWQAIGAVQTAVHEREEIEYDEGRRAKHYGHWQMDYDEAVRWVERSIDDLEDIVEAHEDESESEW